MATAKKAAPKKRDYSAERLRTKQNKQKAAAGTDAQEDPEPARTAPKKAKAVQNIDLGQCGHIDVALSSIISDPNQPRKFFDAGKLLELSKTIVEHGVLEPILIRPIPGDLYMVVFGERRFRASLMAGEAGHTVTTIPAMIKEMTDAQALEVQLIENLHRTDPHPIEDAHTFKRMLENHSIEEIALRIVKSTKFVAMRLMLCDLSPAFQEVFFANKMSLGQAMHLCKVNTQAQEAIFSDEVPDDWKEDPDFMLDDIQRLVNQEQKNLDSAPFKTEDAELYPEMGACGKCQFNSANTLQLFVEQQTSRICGNAVCYNIKCVRSYKANIEEVKTDPSVVFVAGSHYADEAKQKVKDVEALGAPVLAYGTWKKVELDEKPDWETYLKDCEGNYDSDSETREEFEAAVKVEFDEAVADWQKEADAIAAARAEGKIHKAFIIVGADEGKFAEVIATTAQAEFALAAVDNGDDPAIALQVAEINKREERAKELDSEKVWQELRHVMLSSNHLDNSDPLEDIERGAMAVAVFSQIGYEQQGEFVVKVLKLIEPDSDNDVAIAKALMKITEKNFFKLCRILFRKTLFPLPGSHEKNMLNVAGYALAKKYIPKQLKDIEANQAAAAAKRGANVEKKIKKLTEPEEAEVE